LTTWLNTPIQMQFRVIDARQIVAGALAHIERYQLPDAVREDYLSSYEGDRMVESMRYVRAYPAELPVVHDLLTEIQTPGQIIAGQHDQAVPPVTAEFLDQRLPHSREVRTLWADRLASRPGHWRIRARPTDMTLQEKRPPGSRYLAQAAAAAAADIGTRRPE
jgi:pimeloyl-ACP methyl ester carboxylesterase